MKARRIAASSLLAAIIGIAAGILVTSLTTRHENGQPVADAKATEPAPRDDSWIDTRNMAKILFGQPEPAPRDSEPKKPEADVQSPNTAGDRVLTAKQLFDAPRPRKFEAVD
jgi:hypothetical protein